MDNTNEAMDQTQETTQEETTNTDQEVIQDNTEQSPKSENETSVEVENQASLEKEKEKYLRLFAEFENYKRRTSKERLELFKTASQEVMQALLPILDDFDRGIKEAEKSELTKEIEGFVLIHNKLKESLKSKGLEEIQVAQGDEFNADHHEAITQIPAPTKELKGKIIDVIEKGYKLGDKTIRFPKVVTGQL